MSDIESCDQLKDAVADTELNERGKQRELIGRAIELGCVEIIPEEWGVEVNNG